VCGIKAMSKIMKVSRSGFYKWRKSGLSKRRRDDAILLEIIRPMFHKFKKRYGSPRIFKEMKALGYRIGQKRVERIMRENKLFSTFRKRRNPKTTDSKHDNPISPNLLNRDFSAAKPNQKLVSDITYLWSKSGWLYLCMIKDLCTKEIIGWSVADHMRTSMVIQALENAVIRRPPAAGLIFHTDRGSQYASHAFREKLKGYEMLQSMSGKGNCYDNAAAESFFATLKCELIFHMEIEDLAHAEKVLFEYIEIFYNRQRRNSSIGYISPAEFAANLAA
jgi:transposase InsO family protein